MLKQCQFQVRLCLQCKKIRTKENMAYQRIRKIVVSILQAKVRLQHFLLVFISETYIELLRSTAAD